jgi:hypothetical protein
MRRATLDSRRITRLCAIRGSSSQNLWYRSGVVNSRVEHSMPNLYPLARPIFGLLRPEVARDLTIRSLEAGFGRLMVSSAAGRPDPSTLSQRLWDLDFINPVGLAAGFDKDARVPDAIINDWHCGFVEVGTAVV